MQPIKKKIVVGLTGGIGSGKSVVRKLFSSLGIGVLNADEVAREITQPGTFCYQAIKNHFGDLILNKDHSLNRGKLKEIIFNDASEKKWLENLLHPEIWQQLEKNAQAASSPYVIVEIPLLVEVNSHPMVDRILVVDIDEKLQVTRLMKRDQLTEQGALHIIQQQAPRQKRLSYADDVLNNDGDLEQLSRQIQELNRKYLKLAD